MTADAIVVFDRSPTSELAFRAKRAGQPTSRTRFQAAQMDAYLRDDLWAAQRDPRQAMAARLLKGLEAVPGVGLRGAVDASILFCRLPQRVIEALVAEGYAFYHDRWEPGVVRFVTSFATTERDVDDLVRAVARHAARTTGGGSRS